MPGKKRKKYIIFFLSFFILTLVLGSTVIYAKYHTIQAQKGVAVASEMYLSSNYLLHTQNNEYTTRYNMDPWDGDQSLFRIQLRNYENKLLYNKGAELKCEVTFQLESTPKTGFRYVVYGSDNQVAGELTDAQSIVKLKDILVPSGQASEVYVYLGIIKNSQLAEENIESDAVIVTANVVSPEYAVNLGPLKAKLKATTSNEAFNYNSKFKIIGEINETNLSSKIEWASGFVYILNTTGGSVNDEIRLRISWNHDLLKLNEFDPLYDADQIRQDSDGARSYIDFTPKLNAQQEMIFYKTSNFTKERIQTKSDFENLVHIEKIK